MLKEIYTNLYPETSGLSVTSSSNLSNITVKVKKGTRDFYNVLIKGCNTRDNYFKKWKEDLNISFNLACQKNIFRNCFFSIQDNDLIWFQYKLIHRLTAINAYLCRIGFSEILNCCLCNEYEETLVHLFVSCQKSIDLWTSVKSWISKKANYGIDYPANIMFGCWELLCLTCQ